MKILLFLITTAQLVLANQIDWSGGYRFEYLQIDRPSLGTPYQRKEYGMHFLYLSPRLIVSDGIQVVTRFDVMGDGGSSYNSYLGSVWGQGNSDSTKPTSKSNTLGRNSASSNIRASQMYFNLSQENASLILGRAPFDFGIGMSYSVGNGLFDHWNSNRDQVSYKMLVDNMILMPFISRHYDDGYAQGNLVQDEGFLVLYDNKQTGNQIGVMLERRKASLSSNDTPVGNATTNPSVIGDSVQGDMSVQKTNFILGKDWDNFSFRLEAGFNSGDLGIVKNGQSVKSTGYGIASEWNFKNASSWNYTIKTGVASGDNPDTTDYEGFQFDRNYDVAFLMFNHRLGTYDTLRSAAIRDTVGLTVGNSPDDEAISNAFYFAPVVKYRWNDKLDLNQTFAWAQLMVSPFAGGKGSKELGFEYDLELNYKIREKVMWSNQLGFVFPGAAFKSDTVPGSENNFTFGFATKIGLQF
jgi:hypothetical protein